MLQVRFQLGGFQLESRCSGALRLKKADKLHGKWSIMFQVLGNCYWHQLKCSYKDILFCFKGMVEERVTVILERKLASGSLRQAFVQMTHLWMAHFFICIFSSFNSIQNLVHGWYLLSLQGKPFTIDCEGFFLIKNVFSSFIDITAFLKWRRFPSYFLFSTSSFPVRLFSCAHVKLEAQGARSQAGCSLWAALHFPACCWQHLWMWPNGSGPSKTYRAQLPVPVSVYI